MSSKQTLDEHSHPYLTTEAQAQLLSDAFDSGDAGRVAHALGMVARARGMSQVARAAQRRREPLYRSLTLDGDPRLSTVLGIAKALGLRLSATET